MATEPARLQTRNPQEERRKTDLTLTGLLMEGLSFMAIAKQALVLACDPSFMPLFRFLE
jgi:hypothetical protein